MKPQDKLNQKLNQAARIGHLSEAETLLRQGADINHRSTGDNSPLFNAAYHGYKEIVALLLEKGADINIRNSVGATPLIGAASVGRLEVVQILLAAGVDGTVLCHGKTAADWAKQNNHSTIFELLSQTPRIDTPDQIIFERPVSNRTLEEIFDFAVRERISLVRKTPGGAVEAVTCTGFSEIEDESALRKAFDEHIRRGGKTEESIVFPNKLLKLKLPPKER